MENNTKPTIEQILGREVLEILHKNQISELRIESDGTLSGSMRTVRGLPVTDYLRNIRIEADHNKIIIAGEIIDSSVDVGKII